MCVRAGTGKSALVQALVSSADSWMPSSGPEEVAEQEAADQGGRSCRGASLQDAFHKAGKCSMDSHRRSSLAGIHPRPSQSGASVAASQRFWRRLHAS